MAIDQVKTISELERLEELLDSYAVAISTGATTGSATLLALSNFLKTYLQDVSKRVQTVDNSPDNYPSTAAVTGYAQTLANLVQDLTSPSATTYLSTEGVKNESDRIISIMDDNFGHSLKANTSAAIDISNPYTASVWGWVLYKGMSNNQGMYIAINDVPICNGLNTGVSPTAVIGSFILAPGDKFSHNGISTSLIKFIPLYES